MSEAEINKQLEDVWEDFREKQDKGDLPGDVKEEVNETLQKYLLQNAEYVSKPVEDYLKTVEGKKPIDVEQRITNLGMLAYERQEFLKKLSKVSGSFSYEVRQLKNLATIKAKKMIGRVTEDLKKLFEGEYRPIVEQYN